MNTTSPFVHKEDIVQGLHRLGLRKGNAVGVHSSLSSLGHVVGGAESVIEALIGTVGPAGAIVMPTYSGNVVYTEPTPKEQALGISWKGRIGRFDPATTSCWTGKIADTFWRRPDVVHSSDPVHSLAAWGRNATVLCQGWEHLLAANGSILLLGVDLSNCSALHLFQICVV